MRNASDENFRENKKHVLGLIFFFENITVYEIMWENTVERDRPRMAV